MSLLSKGNRVRRAAAAVELAVLAPLFGTVVVGMMELSRGVQAKESLSNSARKAARTGIQRNKGSTDIYNDALKIMQDNGYTTTVFNPAAPGTTATSANIGSITITVTDPNNNSVSDAIIAPEGSQISVQVSIPVSSVMWITPYFTSLTSLESETVVMMKQ